MSRPIPPHGHPNRYAYGCRCAPCTRAATRADLERRMDRLAGRSREVPAGPSMEHVRKLSAARLTKQQIARETGVEPSTVARLLAGEQKTVMRTTEQKILAVPLDVRVTLGDVPALGAIRRVRALYALGHFNREIAAEAGVSRDMVCALAAGQWPTLNVRRDEGIRRAYDRLSMSVGESWKTRRLAEREGWAPPLAWDDEAIDDPKGRPRRGTRSRAGVDEAAAMRVLEGEKLPLNAETRTTAVLIGIRRGLSYEYVARVLDMEVDSVKQSWERHKRKARAAGAAVPIRPDWVVAA